MFLNENEKQVLSKVIKIEEDMLKCHGKTLAIRGYVHPDIIKELLFSGYKVTETSFPKSIIIKW